MKSRIIFTLTGAALLLLASFTSCKNVGSVVDYGRKILGGGDRIKIVTYNVGAFNKPGFCTEHMCEQMLKELSPDAISLNELDSCNSRGGIYTDQLAQVAKSMGDWPYIFGCAIPYRGGSYGIGVLVDPDCGVVDKWAVKLPQADGKEVRALAVIETEKFVLCSTHLDLTESARLVQVAAIDSLVAERYAAYSKPVFLCGDMNSEYGSKTLYAITEDWSLLSSKENTFSTNNPCKCIDYVFAYKNAASVKVVEHKVYTQFKDSSINAVLASDHFPSYVEVEIIK